VLCAPASLVIDDRTELCTPQPTLAIRPPPKGDRKMPLRAVLLGPEIAALGGSRLRGNRRSRFPDTVAL
jgi:hypothetical protein